MAKILNYFYILRSCRKNWSKGLNIGYIKYAEKISQNYF